jgi:hypothetical protein
MHKVILDRELILFTQKTHAASKTNSKEMLINRYRAPATTLYDRICPAVIIELDPDNKQEYSDN